MWSDSHCSGATLVDDRATSDLVNTGCGGAEVARTESFPVFALKCSKVLKNDMTASDAKATKLLGDAGVTYRGSKVNKSMANAVLMFRPGTIEGHALELLCKNERDHGREAFCGGYVKIARLVQLCIATAKATLEHSSTELITYVLGAIELLSEWRAGQSRT